VANASVQCRLWNEIDKPSQTKGTENQQGQPARNASVYTNSSGVQYPRPEKSVVRRMTSTVSKEEIPVALTAELDWVA
jgi:hypothetical protein